MKKLILAVALATITSAAFAGSLTTVFDDSNGLGEDGMIFFNLNVVSGLTITGFDLNVFDPAAEAFSINVYTRSGSVSGFEQSSAGWTLVGSGAGLTAGTNNPSFINVSDFSLGSGVTGMAIHYLGGQVNYFNGNGSNEFYSNADLSLTGVSASNSTAAGFDGTSVFAPRVFSGTVYYDAVPEPATMSVLALAGIAALRRKRKA